MASGNRRQRGASGNRRAAAALVISVVSLFGAGCGPSPATPTPSIAQPTPIPTTSCSRSRAHYYGPVDVENGTFVRTSWAAVDWEADVTYFVDGMERTVTEAFTVPPDGVAKVKVIIDD